MQAARHRHHVRWIAGRAGDEGDGPAAATAPARGLFLGAGIGIAMWVAMLWLAFGG